MDGETMTSEPPIASAGNVVVLYDDGHELFQEIALAIRGATRRVWIETFLLTPDEIGRTVIDLAADAAHRGCDVILLFDQAGSHITNLGFFRPVEEAGGRVGIFNALPPWRRYGRRLGSMVRHRDHRKIIVADDVAFCGGHNLSGSYLGPPPVYFYDLSLKLRGPCVRDLARVLLGSFAAATGETRALPPAPTPLRGGVPARALAHDGTRGVHELLDAYHSLLESAREEALLMFAYFLPDEVLRAPILAAAERGVRVTLVTAGDTDVPAVRIAGQHTYDSLLSAGVRIFQLHERNLHAKAMVIDGERSLVGSFDVNQLQRRGTAEVAVLVEDATLAGQLRSTILACAEASEEITTASREKRSRVGRTMEWALYRLARFG
jgi:cardiolipin synthase A/B